MDAPKLLVVTMTILAVSVLVLDVTTATIVKDNMQDEIKRHMLNNMEDAIHLGELRKGNLTLDDEQFISSWQRLDNQSYTVSAQIVRNSPALVTVVGGGRINHLSRWLDVSETSLTVKYVAILDLREEEN